MYKNLFICWILVLSATACFAVEKSLDQYLVADNNNFSVYYQVTTKKLWANAEISSSKPSQQEVTINACKGETEIFTLFFKVKKNLEKINIVISDLKHKSENSMLKKGIFSSQLLGTVNALDNKGKKRLAFDKVYNTSKTKLLKGKSSAFMIKLKIPYNIKSGYYNGNISILADKKQLAVIPIKIKIYDFALSPKGNLLFNAGLPKYKASSNPLKRKKGDQDLPVNISQVKATWIKQLNKDRIFTHNASIAKPILTKQDGKYILDFTKFDKQVDELIKKKVLFRARTPFLYIIGGHYWYPLEKYFGDITSPPGDKTKRPGSTYLENDNLRLDFLEAYIDVAKQVNAHINKKAYRPYFIDVLCDEPAIRLKSLVKKIGKALVKAVPDIQLAILGMPVLSAQLKEFRGIQKHLFIVDKYVEQVYPNGRFDKKNDEILEVYSLYSALTLDNEPLYSRLLFWWAWNVRADCMWYWVIGQWSRPSPLNCYGGNGGFYLVYPNKQNINSEFLTGIRYEQFREGLEDFEYLVELEKRFSKARKELKGTIKEFPDKTRSDEFAQQLVPSHRFLDRWVSDSNKYIKVKKALFDEIETINTAPLILTKSSIPDGATTENSKVSLTGLVNSKANISIDGKVVKNVNGRFSYIKNLKMGKNTLRVSVTKGSKKKIIKRVYYRKKKLKFKKIINDDFSLQNSSYNGLEYWKCYDWGRKNGSGKATPPELVLKGQVKKDGDASIKSGYIRPLSTHSGMSRTCKLEPPPNGKISFYFYTLNDVQFKLKIEVFGKLNGKKVKMQKWLPAEETGNFNKYTVNFNQLSKYQPGVVVNNISIFVIETKNSTQDWRYWIDDFKVEYPVKK